MRRDTVSENRGNGSKGKTIVIVLVILALLLAVCCGGLLYYSKMGEPLDKTDSTAITVTIQSGASTADIGQILEQNGIVASGDRFKLWSKIKGYDVQYKAGTYTLSPSMSSEQIAEILVGGKVDTFQFTIPEGYTIKQLAEALEQQGAADGSRILALAGSHDFDEEFTFLKEAQDNENHMEGYLLPNTYIMPAGSSEEDIIRVMLKQFEKDAMPLYEAASKQGMSLNDFVIAASIVEREAVVSEERPLVASVIYNRLDQDMLLQMCSTVQYILGEPKAILSYADTEIDSPYNTYKNPGLPPGPICSPGKASLEAAMNPADTDYLYFVLSDKLDGTSNFSADYDQFLRDKEAYGRAYEAAN